MGGSERGRELDGDDRDAAEKGTPHHLNGSSPHHLNGSSLGALSLTLNY